MKQLPAIIGWTLLFMAFAIYVYGISYAVFNPDEILDANKKLIGLSIPEPLDTLTATIGAMLLTNFGAVLGISISSQDSALAKTIIQRNITVPVPLSKREAIQLMGVVIYLIVLIACFVKWAMCSFVKSTDIRPVVPLVQQYGKTLIGVITAYIAFILGIK